MYFRESHCNVPLYILLRQTPRKRKPSKLPMQDGLLATIAIREEKEEAVKEVEVVAKAEKPAVKVTSRSSALLYILAHADATRLTLAHVL